MTGVHPLTFWFANILWDGLLFVIAMSVFIIALIAMDQRESFSSNAAEGKSCFSRLVNETKFQLDYDQKIVTLTNVGQQTLTIEHDRKI